MSQAKPHLWVVHGGYMLTFNKNYFVCSMLILTIEVLIALFVRDKFVRPYLGDGLVVILIYCFIRSFLSLPVLRLAIYVLTFAVGVEFLQLAGIVEKLRLNDSAIARTVIGTSFAWADLLAYGIGITSVVLVEKFILRKNLLYAH